MNNPVYKFDVILTVHRRQYVEIKCHLDATEVFIAGLIACLTCFGGASLCPSSGAQEYYTVVAACGISCCQYQSAAAQGPLFHLSTTLYDLSI